MIQGYNPKQDNAKTITSLGNALQEDAYQSCIDNQPENIWHNSVDDMLYEQMRDNN